MQVKRAAGLECSTLRYRRLQIVPSGDADVKVVNNNLRMRGRDFRRSFHVRQKVQPGRS